MDLWKKKFIIIWSGQLFSILSSAIVGYSVMFWLSIETKSAEVLSYAVLATLLPQALLGPIAGVYVDRWKRKLTMIAADSFVALCSLILGGLFYFDQAELGLIYLLMALRSIGNAFHSPAMQAAIPMLAPESELMRIAGVNQALQSVSSIAGPALGALLITSLNMTVVMLQGRSSLVPLWLLLRSPTRSGRKKNGNPEYGMKWSKAGRKYKNIGDYPG